MAHVCCSRHLHTCRIRNASLFDTEDPGFAIVEELFAKHNWVLATMGWLWRMTSASFPLSYEFSFTASSLSSSSSSSFPSTSSSSPCFSALNCTHFQTQRIERNYRASHSRVYFSNDHANSNFRYSVLRLQALCQMLYLSCLQLILSHFMLRYVYLHFTEKETKVERE